MATQPTTTQTISTKEVADGLVKLCSQGKFEEAMKTFYSPGIVSVEAGAPPGESREARGLPAVTAKSEWWNANHEVHSATVEGPLVAGSHFAVTISSECGFKCFLKSPSASGSGTLKRRS